MTSVVISGISGRFPASDDVEDFYRKLLNKESTVTEFFRGEFGENDSPNASFPASKLQSITKFDQTFFSVHSRIAHVLDPLIRCFIEPCFEAILDAGSNPKSLAGTNTSVYTNSCISDDESLGCDERLTTNFWLLAHVRCLLANRIAYLFDLKGPSFTIDNSWTGGIEVLKQAVGDIVSGRVDSAIVGVSNLLLNPKLNALFQGLNRLSPDGKTRSFDDQANGYVRSEGIVVLFLQRSDVALRSYGEVVAVESIFHGSLERPLVGFNETNLIEFFTEFYRRAGIDPSQVEFLEADGSGVKSLDSLELSLVSQLFGKGRRSPLKLGSVKSNMGHSEGASALISMVKALMAMNTSVIAPNIDFETPNPHLDQKTVQVVTEPTPLTGDLVAVNSLSLTGSVGHVLLRRHPDNVSPATKEEAGKKKRLYPRLVLVSSRTQDGIARIVEKLESMPFNNDFCSLVNEAFKEPINGLFYNGYTLLPAPPTKPIHGSLLTQPIKRPVWFVFAGMGSQWPGMGRELMLFAPFRQAVFECDRIYRPLGLDIVHIITTDDPTIYHDILNSFVAIVTCHIGLVNILRAVGIEAEGYLGHSLGENGVAYADGCFNVREACLGGYARGYASKMIKLAKPGLMVSVGLNYKDLTDLPPSIDIACHNSDDNTTISGTEEDIIPYLEGLKARDVFYRVVNSGGIAYHSRQVKPLAPEVLRMFRDAVPNPKKRSSKWISTSIPEEEWDSPLAQTSSAEYHVNNFLKTVRFWEACAHIPEHALVIEVAPHGLMQALLKRTTHETCVNIPLCRRQAESPTNFLLAALGQLHMNGLRPNIEALYEPVSFPVSRGTPCLSPCIFWNHEDDWDVALSAINSKNEMKHIDLLCKEYRPLFSHQVGGAMITPVSLFLVDVFEKLCSLEKKNALEEVFVCEEYKVENLVEVTASDVLDLRTEISAGSGGFEQIAGTLVVSTGRTYFQESNQGLREPWRTVGPQTKQGYEISEEMFYETLREHQYELAKPFDLVRGLTVYDEGCHARIVFNGDLMVYLDTIFKVKVFLDLKEDGVPVFPSRLRGFVMSPNIIAQLTPGQTVDVYLDFNTGELSAPGVLVSKLDTSSFHFDSELGQDEAKIHSIHFVPHFTSLQKNVGTKRFLYCLIQLMIDSFTVRKRESHLTLVSVNNCFPTDIVKHIQNKLKAVAQAEVLHSQSVTSSCDLLLCSYEALREAPSTQLNALFLLVSLSPDDVIDQSYNVVAHYQFKEEGLLLIRNRTKPLKYSVIRPQSTPHWIKCLKTKDTPLLVWESPNVDVQNVVKQINAMGHPVVCIFLLDPKAPKFSLDESFYQQQLSKQLKINIFKNGEWGSYYYENVTPVPQMKYPVIMPDFFGSAKYLALNLNDITHNISDTERKQELGHIEFSGMIEGGGRIMGLARYDTPSCTIHPDPELTWHVPEEWNLQDAVTVPFVYTTVYNALIPKLELCLFDPSTMSILIQAGHTLLGQAAITFALSRQLQVFTTVPDVKKYTPLLKQLFPKLKVSHIFSHSSHHYDVEVLLATKGRGVQFVFGSLCGEPFNAAINCASKFASFIQVGPKDMRMNKTLGLSFFLPSRELIGGSRVNIYSASKETKRKIKKIIEKDIQDGIIQPMKRHIFDTTETHDALRALKTDSQETKIVLSLTRNPNCDCVFTCLPNRTYLVVVNSTVKSPYWLHLVKWLLKRSAHRIILAFEPAQSDDFIDRSINNIMAKYPDSVLIFMPLSSMNSVQGVTRALQGCIQSKINTLDGVFTVKLDDTRLSNLDTALRQLAPSLPVFLCLQSYSETVCESRRAANMPSLCVQCSSPRDLIRNLDTLTLECNAMTTAPLVVVQPKQLESYISPNVLQDIFPLSLDELVAIASADSNLLDSAENGLEAHWFSPARTKSPGRNLREVLPVFFVSSLGTSYLQPLLDQILYPALVSTLPGQITSIAEYARGLTRSLKSIQNQGPYTIVGDIWSSCAVLEMSKLLEKGGDKVVVVLIEGLPDTVESSMSDIVNLDSPTLEVELLGDLVQTEHNISLNKSLDENLTQILSSLDEPTSTACKTTLESLISRIVLSSQYVNCAQAHQERVRSPIVYVCFSHTPILQTYNAFEKYHCGDLILKVSEASSYFPLIQHTTTASIINDYASYTV
uniref:Fatty acid synthase n=1 Tax=Cacopsylla melanoneura TaxID=428564 RepID=A0A8D8PTU4_9HEMI